MATRSKEQQEHDNAVQDADAADQPVATLDLGPENAQREAAVAAARAAAAAQADDDPDTGPLRKIDLERGYVKADPWNGIERFACVYCQWDTLDGETAAADHVVAEHRPQVADPSLRRAVPIFDKHGNLIRSGRA